MDNVEGVVNEKLHDSYVMTELTNAVGMSAYTVLTFVSIAIMLLLLQCLLRIATIFCWAFVLLQ